ncbi:MAG TPA: LysR family transcriptional regulator [Burkholderiales bacterium]|nr:LysR family transcriptional regulator [Burkholderiales bacterium]
MNPKNLDLNLLMVFDAIAAEGNLTRAAKRLRMSQPAMGNTLARLRAALDDPLFTHRSGHDVHTARQVDRCTSASGARSHP